MVGPDRSSMAQPSLDLRSGLGHFGLELRCDSLFSSLFSVSLDGLSMDVLKCLSNLSTVGPSNPWGAPRSHQRHCSAAAGSRTSDGDATGLPRKPYKGKTLNPLNISTPPGTYEANLTISHPAYSRHSPQYRSSQD